MKLVDRLFTVRPRPCVDSRGIVRRDAFDVIPISVNDMTIQIPAGSFRLLRGPVPPPEFVSNGCGPKLGGTLAGKLLTHIVPDGIAGWCFRAPCHFHDYAYTGKTELGGTWRARRAADFNLGWNVSTMIAEAHELNFGLVVAIGFLYWFGVRCGGWCAFRYNFEDRITGRWQKLRERFMLFRGKGRSDAK